MDVLQLSAALRALHKHNRPHIVLPLCLLLNVPHLQVEMRVFDCFIDVRPILLGLSLDIACLTPRTGSSKAHSMIILLIL